MADVVEVTRCKDCKYYISIEDMKKDPYFKNYPYNTAAVIGSNALCLNFDRWMHDNDFCSHAEEKEE